MWNLEKDEKNENTLVDVNNKFSSNKNLNVENWKGKENFFIRKIEFFRL